MIKSVYFWKKSVFIRLLPPLIAGIILQWYEPFPASVLYLTALLSLIVIVIFFVVPFFTRYKFSFLSGFFTFLLFACIGGILTYNKSVKYECSAYTLATIDEPPIKKPRSYKTIARLSANKIIIYFSTRVSIKYGDQIVFKKSLQEIKNTGTFDYKRYCYFQGITHQVYLDSGQFVLLPTKKKDAFKSFLLRTKEKILDIIKRNISDPGLAEALLLGYKDDLDKTLVQSYSNTGVVHIIAISGLHLGLIYVLLVKLFQPFRRKRHFFVITGLWLFSLLAGAQPSVLRSALMFSCIAAGEGFGRKTNIYNSLALSAFILLCYNPYWLWDVGFQLSYAAVISIVLFMRPIYNLLFFKNKIVDAIWKLNAVTLSAQVLTLPFTIYYFHQFPTYFLLANLVAVPLSSFILIGEIFLCCIAFIKPLALLTGKILSWLIGTMNLWIERTGELPFSRLEGLQVSLSQTIILFLFITATSHWLMKKSANGLKTALIALLIFVAIRQ